jgi:uncharacterized membrane protein (UPF0127 family)/phosphatidylglycerophosphate synthase
VNLKRLRNLLFDMKKYAANIVTSSRFVFGLIMVYLSIKNKLILFLIFYILALVSDILDGFFARKFYQQTKFGGKFDIIADNFIVLCLLIGLYYLKSESLKYWVYFAYIFVYYIFVQIISLVKVRKLIFMRTYVANFTAIFFPFVILSLIFSNTIVFVYVYCFLMIYSLTEKLFLQIKNKKYSIFRLKIKQILFFFLIVIILSSGIFLIKTQTHVCFEKKCIEVEIMDTAEKRALGLMYRQKINESEGMLFILDRVQIPKFWMKNVQFSIDMIFIDENLTIVDIEKGVPPCYYEPCLRYSPGSEVLYVVEVISGFSDTYNITKNKIIKIK